ncbi:MAG: SigB/SigF/SigG family RNA polymerase sigma factor [Anaerotignum sp.]|nr:SigB/SigF/SigG family RNA polymerase sigma factor [Anaerotignum sp.]MBR5793396.1 SigB/SigF/SigG family RNA polymerase sigma factor [Anaerotignum sp.]
MEHIYECIRRAQEGDKEAKEQLIRENNGLIWSIVKRFSGRAEQEDLYQIGAIGLLKCIEKFDFTYEVKFSTYAVPMIIGEIKRFLRDDGTIKVSRSLKELSFRIRQLQEESIKRDNKELTISELAEKLETNVEEIILAIESTREVESLFKTIGEQNGQTFLIDQLKTSSENDILLENISLKEALNYLNVKERQIIFMRYYQDRTQTDIAKQLGISQVQVSRIEKRVLQSMKKSMQ